MNKYRCLCGMKFKKEEKASEHYRAHRFQDNDVHFIFTRTWKDTLWDLFLSWNWSRAFRALGVLTVYFVLVNHFDVNLSIKESVLMGLGLGLSID